MKKFFLANLLLAFSLFILKATPVNPNLTRLAAENFYNNTFHKSQSSAAQFYTFKTKTYNCTDSIDCIRIYNFDNGYVVISTDSRIEPILGYSDNGPFDMQNIPAGLGDMLHSYCDEIAVICQNSSLENEYLQNKWNKLITNSYQPNYRSTNSVSPLIGNNNWQQNNGYNYYCPSDNDGPAGHAYVGCVALAMGQVIHYWQYPEHGIGTHSYECNHSSSQAGNYPDYGTLTADFEHTYYDYSMMPNYLTSSTPSNQILPIAKLLYHCGVSVEMFYGPQASMAFHQDIADALETYFAYDTCKTLYKSSHESTWDSLLRDDLDSSRPIIYCAYANEGGHEFVCDGYNAQGYFHFNWGWGGYANGYFAVNNMNPGSYNFNSSHGIIANIHPKETQEDTSSSIRENEWASVQIYPNPTGNTLTIKCEETPISSIIIFNAEGKVLISKQLSEISRYNINVSKLPRGNYFIKISSSKGTITKPFVKL